jgi:hypothetical protein
MTRPPVVACCADRCPDVQLEYRTPFVTFPFRSPYAKDLGKVIFAGLGELGAPARRGVPLPVSVWTVRFGSRDGRNGNDSFAFRVSPRVRYRTALRKPFYIIVAATSRHRALPLGSSSTRALFGFRSENRRVRNNEKLTVSGLLRL